ncbi:hypothetical protein ANCDUO_16379 [Ancylostoma duodenale]|uniref:Uncharacterized protein n=1 Tax=Ancylostoma duodenale TaxID=51022 RepID=A0A0C2CUJ7_9BILA|nr:hypothetical protein ANCDUO_16379 [Ancylostoma duodenale]
MELAENWQKYGDPIDPIGDLREVWKTACLLKPGGFEWVATYRGHTHVAVQLTQCDLEYAPNPPAKQDLFVLRKQ